MVVAQYLSCHCSTNGMPSLAMDAYMISWRNSPITMMKFTCHLLQRRPWKLAVTTAHTSRVQCPATAHTQFNAQQLPTPSSMPSNCSLLPSSMPSNYPHIPTSMPPSNCTHIPSSTPSKPSTFPIEEELDLTFVTKSRILS